MYRGICKGSSGVSLQDNSCSLRTDATQRADRQTHTTDTASCEEPAPKGPFCYFKIAHIQNKTTCIVISLPYVEMSYFCCPKKRAVNQTRFSLQVFYFPSASAHTCSKPSSFFSEYGVLLVHGQSDAPEITCRRTFFLKKKQLWQLN